MMTRRDLFAATAASVNLWSKESPSVRQATGFRIGEITPDSAAVWARHTAAVSRLNGGIVRTGHAPKAAVIAPGDDVNKFEGACPGAAGAIRVMAEPASGRGRKITSRWVDVGAETDFSNVFRLTGLQPDTPYKLAAETRKGAALTGSFRTAPVATQAAGVHFALSSCQIYCRQDRPDGFHIYESIERLAPHFLLSCGDNVYYDSEDPVVNSAAVARYHWQRMYSLPPLLRCLRTVPGYWQKDDHDVFSDDSWPGRAVAKQAPFNYEEGRKLFREQVPAPPEGQPMYRRFRWGRDLEVILPDSRDYRSPNDAPDGPSKSIWGAEQKKWIQQALSNSDAAWKIMVNPNPIVGPDHARKNDNHANPAFAHESREFRHWLKDNVPGRVIVMNGDRHWQYHSVDPDTGLHEFGCGPASDEHAVPPSRGEDKRFHKFLRVKGGFVTIRVNPDDRESHLVFEHRDVMGQVVHRAVFGNPMKTG
ncbi:MAG: alkaline phosphatase family protein [Acidobacteria bacterium]|nr:alkaline phosphatase family protein [Acidobacteriota bacterium]